MRLIIDFNKLRSKSEKVYLNTQQSSIKTYYTQLTMRLTFPIIAAATLLAPTFADAKWWAQFCTDNDATQNCSESFDMNNAGCFAINSDAKSMKFHSSGVVESYTDYSLIFSPQAGCNCQNGKQTVRIGAHGSPPGVTQLLSIPRGSVRWISGQGSDNNC